MYLQLQSAKSYRWNNPHAIFEYFQYFRFAVDKIEHTVHGLDLFGIFNFTEKNMSSKVAPHIGINFDTSKQ